jgi:hypothetical protein
VPALAVTAHYQDFVNGASALSLVLVAAVPVELLDVVGEFGPLRLLAVRVK